MPHFKLMTVLNVQNREFKRLRPGGLSGYAVQARDLPT